MNEEGVKDALPIPQQSLAFSEHHLKNNGDNNKLGAGGTVAPNELCR